MIMALEWLDSLEGPSEPSNLSVGKNNIKTYRILTKEEELCISAECMGFLLTLEDLGVLSEQFRELIIESAMSIANGPLTLRQFTCLIGMIFLHCVEDDELLFFIEDLLLSKSDIVVH